MYMAIFTDESLAIAEQDTFKWLFYTGEAEINSAFQSQTVAEMEKDLHVILYFLKKDNWKFWTFNMWLFINRIYICWK